MTMFIKRERLESLLDELADLYNWEDVFQAWKKELYNNGISLGSLFTEMDIYDPEYPTEREPALTWLSKETPIVNKQTEVQRHFYHFPGTYGPINEGILKGENQTLTYLLEDKDNIENIAAILISASIFPHVANSRRYYYPDDWPDRYFVEKICRKIVSQWNSGSYRPWHYLCTDVLPTFYRFSDEDCKAETLLEFISYIAEGHAALFHQYRLVIVNYVPKPNPFIQKILLEEKRQQEEKMQLEQKRREEEKLKKEEQQKQIASLLGDPKRKEPSLNSWPVTDEELQKLIWMMPTRDLAKIVGYSDVAITKRCKKKGIPKPPVGFWAKVEAGKIPHPEGVPIEQKSTIDRQKLLSAVWSMSTIKVAQLYGVSDSTIGEWCKELGIPKPPVGFWAKVDAGKIPHPNGNPVVEQHQK